MKKWIKFNLLLTAVTAGVLVLTAAKPLRSGVQSVLFPHPNYCWKFLDVTINSYQVGCDASCPPGCTDLHMHYEILDVYECECSDGLFYNPNDLTCDYPDRVECPHAIDCHTINRDEVDKI